MLVLQWFSQPKLAFNIPGYADSIYLIENANNKYKRRCIYQKPKSLVVW